MKTGVLAGAALHSTVAAALRDAGGRAGSRPVDTRDLLLALMRADQSGRWARIWLYTGDIDAIADKVAIDPDTRTSAEWCGIPVTDTCAVALETAGHLAQRYRLWPLPVGLVVLGLVVDETTAAAQILSGDGLDHAELLRRIQSEVLGIPLTGLETILPGVVAQARSRAAGVPAVAPRPPSGPIGGNGIYCRVCGSTPAAQASFCRHQGFVLVMRFPPSESGPFCRDCGLATYRSMSEKSLWQGWWGPMSMFINAMMLFINLMGRRAVARLPAPIPGAPGRPLSPGRPLYLRPAIITLAVPITIIVAIATSGGDSSSHSLGDLGSLPQPAVEQIRIDA
ncbi:hypothetical protein [Nocardia concava]|uniref:hypothetical protein n=1 Tax=Nocardia concava TaxID=257281 RepID=UPI0002E0D008|nr:hypothetical protein [Nocardia concava]